MTRDGAGIGTFSVARREAPSLCAPGIATSTGRSSCCGRPSWGLTAIYIATHGPAREFLLLSVQQNFERQLQWFVISAFVMGAILFTSARFIYKVAPWVYAVCIVLLAVTIVAGTVVNGASTSAPSGCRRARSRRWERC